MEAFNIKIPIDKQQITLTILPIDNNAFKVIYFGGILGVIIQEESIETWQEVKDQDSIIGDLPPYRHIPGEGRIKIDFNEDMIAKIGHAIDKTRAF